MKHALPYFLLIFLLVACGSKKQPGDDFSFEDTAEDKEGTSLASQHVDLVNKGVGPITEVTLAEEIDTALVARGTAMYEERCLVCHKPKENFIGPAPAGILQRRTPEWVMNMILNPGKMIKEDSLAQALFMEYNGSPMSDMQLTEEDARAVLEYFRTL